jgi:phosphohistidine phosphatase
MPGSKQLFVLRHAKSSWDDPTLADHDRPLAPRGHRAVEALAQHLRANDIRPALVLCSTARRARETLDGINVGGEHVLEPGLYSADCEQLLDRLRRVPEEIDSVMLVGHNPALQTLVLSLAGGGAGVVDSRLSQVRRKFPTGALAILTVTRSWRALAPRCGRLETYIRPKSLDA